MGRQTHICVISMLILGGGASLRLHDRWPRPHLSCDLISTSQPQHVFDSNRPFINKVSTLAIWKYAYIWYYFYSPTGIPQGYVLEPIIFSLYFSPIAEIASTYLLAQHQYADDTQLYVAVTRFNLPLNVQQLEWCLADLHTWFCLNG